MAERKLDTPDHVQSPTPIPPPLVIIPGTDSYTLGAGIADIPAVAGKRVMLLGFDADYGFGVFAAHETVVFTWDDAITPVVRTWYVTAAGLGPMYFPAPIAHPNTNKKLRIQASDTGGFHGRVHVYYRYEDVGTV